VEPWDTDIVPSSGFNVHFGTERLWGYGVRKLHFEVLSKISETINDKLSSGVGLIRTSWALSRNLWIHYVILLSYPPIAIKDSIAWKKYQELTPISKRGVKLQVNYRVCRR
jgi:hypothetical protein